MEWLKKQKSIRTAFNLYLGMFCLLFSLTACILVLMYFIALKLKIIIPANYNEKQIASVSDKIRQGHDLEKYIPSSCTYAVYDVNGTVLEGNATPKQSRLMWRDVKNYRRSEKYFYYKTIEIGEHLCIIKYYLKAHFPNKKLNQYFPSPDLYLLLIIIGCFVVELWMISLIFTRKMSKEFTILQNTVQKIKTDHLDFNVELTEYREFNDILDSLDKMKGELKDSLTAQWNLQKLKKEQTSALAHDIKTPLTIIRGNAELLEETGLNEEQESYHKNITNSIHQMEQYLNVLLDIMKSEKETTLNFELINTKHMTDEIIETANSLAAMKGILFKADMKNLPDTVCADETALHRAIMNIISNAIAYTPEQGNILFSSYSEKEKIYFVVEDSGSGFSKEELTSAKELFFQGDKSRKSKTHYGIGLYVTSNFVKGHGGTLFLDNSDALKGAKVTVELPVSCPDLVV